LLNIGNGVLNLEKSCWLALLLISSFWLSSCSEDSTKEKVANEIRQVEQNEDEEEQEQEEVVQEENPEEDIDVTEETSTTSTEQVSVGIGLGDSYEAFQNKYGENIGDEMMARFQEDYLLPIFMEGRAWNIKIQFEATSEPVHTLEGAKAIAKQYIPKDAKFVKEYTDDLPRVVMEYTSESIAKLFPTNEPVGTFIVIFSHQEGKPNDVFGITVGVGNNP
jgi:hypothetical protein